MLLNLSSPTLVLADEQLPNPDPNKEIIVSLSQQRLVAFDNHAIIVDTWVTTGGPQTATPIGIYQIISKLQNFTMHSPWPQSDWRWYKDSLVHFGLLYQTGGYFIHDASWRNNFGPGSSTAAGTPGGDFTGTHGCVNVPLDVETKLYAWAEVGMTVIVQP